MKKNILFFFLFFQALNTFGQLYDHEMHCGNDTIKVDSYNRMTGRHIKYKAFLCTQVSNFGFRLNVGFNTYSYNNSTKRWLGNHNGALVGLVFVYKNFGLGVNINLATINPKTELIFNSLTLPKEAKLNPIKIDYGISYSHTFKYNFSIEPYLALTNSRFYVINEKELNQKYNIENCLGLTTGLILNKYFNLKEFKFLALFVKYSYGFTNFKKINNQLGTGYSDISFGIACKGFYKRSFHKHID